MITGFTTYDAGYDTLRVTGETHAMAFEWETANLVDIVVKVKSDDDGSEQAAYITLDEGAARWLRGELGLALDAIDGRTSASPTMRGVS